MNGPFPREPALAAEALLGPLSALRVVKKAVILAAGRGRRMGKLTADRPKAALEVGGHAMIDWQIATLRAAGVEEVAIVTGHGAAALAGRDVSYIHNPNWSSGTQVETLLCARDWIGDEPVIVSYGDVLYHPCAPLALLERPGDLVIAYDADHRWLWKNRFGNWLKDSETFVLGPGQVLTEIGGKPTDIEAIDGQFMGLMLFTAAGLAQLTRRYRKASRAEQRGLDFTRLLSGMITAGERIDTAANILPWMEVDGPADLRIAQTMCQQDEITGAPPRLAFPPGHETAVVSDAARRGATARPGPDRPSSPPWNRLRLEPYVAICDHEIDNAFAVQNWGRSGSTLVQSLFDDHPQVLSTPNFYSRRFYTLWSSHIAACPDHQKIDLFLEHFRQWWDTALVDAPAGLHRLGPDRRQLAGVERERLEGYLRAAFSTGRPYTRRNLFEAAHLAYALARGQELAPGPLQILFPIHGEPRGVAAALIEDFPEAKFLHTVRDPVSNLASMIEHLRFNNLDIRTDALELALQSLFARKGQRSGRSSTVFADRPYFRHLAARDRARLLRLEDLHRQGTVLVLSAAGWLGLQPNERLGLSSWDGKIWWNRPESGRESRLGAQVHINKSAKRLGLDDRGRIELLTASLPQIQIAYGLGATAKHHGAWARLTVLLSPWRPERCIRRTPYRSVDALLKISPILPKTLTDRLRYAAKRERYRTRLLEMTWGATTVRKALPDERKPNAVNALLMVTPGATEWRTRALTGGGADSPEGSDRLTIIFLDETTRDRSVADNAFWLFVLTVGWLIARLGAYLRVRLMMVRLMTVPRRGDLGATMKILTTDNTENT